MMPHLSEQIIKGSGNGCLTVCTCHTYEMQFLGWIAIECCSNLSYICLSILYLYICDIRIDVLWNNFT